MLPRATSTHFHGQREASDSGPGLAAASVPELAAAVTVFALLGLAGLSPWWLEKGNRVNVTKGLLSSELYHLVSLPKGCQEFINYRLMLIILPKKLTVKGATCL